MSDVSWLIKEIKLIHIAYDLRGFYNAHKEQILRDQKTYFTMMRQANKLLNSSVDALDRSTIENFLFDYECDKEQYDFAKKRREESEARRAIWEGERNKHRGVLAEEQASTKIVEPEYESVEMTTALRKLNERLPPSKSVRIEILNLECDNLHDEVRKEIFRVVLQHCRTKTQAAKRLGLSIRTVRNFLDEMIKGDTNERTI